MNLKPFYIFCFMSNSVIILEHILSNYFYNNLYNVKPLLQEVCIL